MPKFGTPKVEPKIESSIIICDRCNGVGYISYENLVDYRNRYYETEWHDCYACKTAGRLKKIVTTTWELVDTNKPKDDDDDSQ